MYFNYNRIKADVIDEEEEEWRIKEKKQVKTKSKEQNIFLMSFRYNTKARYIHNAMYLK